MNSFPKVSLLLLVCDLSSLSDDRTTDPKAVKSIVVNHGSRQNHPHLHVKVTIRKKAFRGVLKDGHQKAFADMKAGVALARSEGRLGARAKAVKAALANQDANL